MIWFEATAVHYSSKANPRQLMITEKNLEKFKNIRQMIKTKAPECIVIMQLTFRSFFKTKDKPEPILESKNDIWTDIKD